MAKILISSLGTGKKGDGGYKKAKYQYDKKNIESTFIARALCDFIDIDKLFLIGTKKSIWDSAYLEFGGDDDSSLKLYEKIETNSLESKDLSQVDEVIDKYLNNKGSKSFIIDYGINEDELWKNFEIFLQILEFIDDHDEIYIDITHSFRSLSLMSFVMIHFGESIRKKKFKIAGIFYGMFEYNSENNGITPIVDLKIFYTLMQWIKAIDTFKNYSNANLLVKLLDEDNTIDAQIKNIFNMFDINISLANINALRKFIQNAKRVFPLFKKTNSNIIKLISTDIEEFIKRLDKPHLYQFQFELSLWFYENKNYALSYITLLEALVSFECFKNNLDETNKDDRNEAKRYLQEGTISSIYSNISRIRNDIAHSRETKISNSKKDVNNLSRYIKLVKEYIYE